MKFLWILLLFVPFLGTAQLQVADIFSDNMVLQRGERVHVWGKGIPGKEVLVSFALNRKNAVVNPDSSWSVHFKKQKANSYPQSIQIRSDNEVIELKNILIGDLWVCIGQSNMEWPMKSEMHFNEELPTVNQPSLRFYNPTYAGKNVFTTGFSDSISQRLNVNDFYTGQWQVSDSISVPNMSAVAYYFGKKIVDDIHVPIGLIHLAIGGAPLETFISRDALQNNIQFSAKATGNWLTNEALPVWARQRGHENTADNANIPSDSLGLNHAFKPGFAFESGIKPILYQPIKGILIYQGESNAQEIERVNEYSDLMKLMVDDYRNQWQQRGMPFYFVQLSSIDTTHYKGHLWPAFRDGQRRILKEIKYSGMAVSSDIGARNDVHPRNKKAVGERLARWALNKTYKKHIVPSGPLPLKAKYVNGSIIISFQYIANGLQTADGKMLRGFSTDGKTAINAIIRNKKIIISAKEKPGFIYYAWEPFTKANLVNSASLPASTFKINVQ